MTVTEPTDQAAIPAPREADQVDVYHGVEVRDPYRWMEDLTDPELNHWLGAQQRRAEAFLHALPHREELRRRLEQVIRARNDEPLRQRGGRWFIARRAEGEDRPVIVVADRPGGDGRAVLDARSLPETTLLGDVEPSPDGRRLLWATTTGGSDWKHWHVTDVDTGSSVDDAVTEAKLWATWLPDSSGFLYIGFPGSGGDRYRPTNVPQLRLHRLGESSTGDEVVFEQPERPRYFFPRFTDDGRLLVLSFLLDNGEIGVCDPDDGWRFRSMISTPTELWCIGGTADELLAVTEVDAANGRVVAIAPGSPQREYWRTVVPETDAPMRVAGRAAHVGDWVLAIRERIGRSVVTMHRVESDDSYTVDLPPDAHVGVTGVEQPVVSDQDNRRVYLRCSTPTNPLLLLSHDITARSTNVAETVNAAPSQQVASALVWCTSADGAQVPMTLVGAPDAVQSTEAPVVIQGYGGAGDSMEPFAFEPWKLAWMEHGGVVANAHIRGGNELGSAWRRAAERTGKVLAMQDFVACAEALRGRGVPRARIAITGRSSGAMLASAAALTRPDLFAAVVAEVGMYDPYRYHLFGLGRLMVSEYGISDDAADFAAMRRIAPLHLAQTPGDYPAFLITVHTDDDRVSPGGAYKFAATLQGSQQSAAPVMLRLRSGAGHHGGSAAGEIDERADILAFLLAQLRS